MANDGKTVRLCITVFVVAKLGMHYHSFIACQCILVLVKGLSDTWGIYCVGRDQRMIAPLQSEMHHFQAQTHLGT